MITQDRRRSLAAAAREARRVGAVITPGLTVELDAHVRWAFADSQEKVGVHSGALKASGRSGSDVRDEGTTYIGGFTYGGPGLDYILYHLAVNDDWLSGTVPAEAAMEATIHSHIARHVR